MFFGIILDCMILIARCSSVSPSLDSVFDTSQVALFLSPGQVDIVIPSLNPSVYLTPLFALTQCLSPHSVLHGITSVRHGGVKKAPSIFEKQM